MTIKLTWTQPFNKGSGQLGWHFSTQFIDRLGFKWPTHATHPTRSIKSTEPFLICTCEEHLWGLTFLLFLFYSFIYFFPVCLLWDQYSWSKPRGVNKHYTNSKKNKLYHTIFKTVTATWSSLVLFKMSLHPLGLGLKKCWFERVELYPGGINS